jgi:AraC family transcriptional regulator, regulatory protein of adaptative response / DNA-3-methyladenine glycosylase II
VTYTLLGADGRPYRSAAPGTLGGHRRSKGYGRLDCPTALRWIAKGHYVRHRVFFADEATALAAGYRPCAVCLPDRYAAWKACAMTIRLVPRAPFDGDHLLSHLAARAVPGVEMVSPKGFSRQVSLAGGSASIALRLDGGEVEAVVRVSDRRDVHEAVRRCRWLLDLDADPAAIAAALGDDPLLAPLVAARPGLRSPGAADGAELAVRAVVGQQISIAGARTLLGRLADAHGTRHAGARLFPTSEQLAAIDSDGLPLPRARARTLAALARALADGEIELRPGADRERVRARLLAIPGIGPWTADYIAMRALGDADVFLAGDLGVRRALGRLGGEAGAAERWRPFRSYATHHLWASVPAVQRAERWADQQ